VDVQSREQDGWQLLADDTFIGGMGEVLERRRDGLVEIALRTTERHRNLSGVVHGGVVMALFDRAIGVNCRNARPDERMATATITINLMRQVQVGDFIEFRCRLRKEGRKAYFADAEAWVADKLVATATGVWMTVA
jgi:uncharacterized protein (TIGR00369 family)